MSRAQLFGIGLSVDDIRYRLRIGRLHSLHRGVYAVGHRKLSWQGVWLAAVLAVEGSALSHISAVMAFGMLRPTGGRIHVTVRRRCASRAGIQVHESNVRHGALHGIPIVAPAVAIRQLCSMRGAPDGWCLRAMNQALVDELVTLDDLFEEAGSQLPGAKRMRRLVWSAAPARSGLEDDTIQSLKRAGLPLFRANARVHGHEVDLYFPQLNLVIEIDGGRYHENPFARAYDRHKRDDLRRRGLRVEVVASARAAVSAARAAAAAGAPA